MHLLASQGFADPEALLSVVKAAPKAAATRTRKACGRQYDVSLKSNLVSQSLPPDAILAIALADLPIEADRRILFQTRLEKDGEDA